MTREEQLLGFIQETTQLLLGKITPEQEAKWHKEYDEVFGADEPPNKAGKKE